MDEKKQNATSDGTQTPKLAWEAPTIQELDFSATEAAYIGIGAIDLGIYSA